MWQVHYRVQSSPPLVRTLSQINPVHTLTLYLRSIPILSLHLSLGFPNSLSLAHIPTTTPHVFSAPPTRATHSTLLTPIHLIPRMLREEYESSNGFQALLCSGWFHSPYASFCCMPTRNNEPIPMDIVWQTTILRN